MISFLIDHGVEQADVLIRQRRAIPPDQMVSLRGYLQIHSIVPDNHGHATATREWYFAEVTSLLGRNKLKIAVRSAAMWIRSERKG